MKHRVKVDVVTQKRGLFGKREIVKEKTVTVSGKEYRRMKREKRNRLAPSEAEGIAGLYLILEEELAEEYGED